MKAVTIAANTPTKIGAAGNRKFITIFNNTGTTLYLCWDGDCDTVLDSTGAALTTAAGYPLASGTSITLSNATMPNQFVHEIWALSVAGGDIRIQGEH